MGMLDKLLPGEITEITADFGAKLDRITTLLERLIEIEEAR